MFKFIKQVFITLLSFIGILARKNKASDRTKHIYLNIKPRLARPTLIYLNSN